MKKLVLFFAFFVSIASISWADEVKEYKIQIKDHKFIPENTVIPADQKIKLIVENLDSTIEEFESQDLSREKIVGGKKSITVNLAPLKPGTYKFFGEFHPKTAQGTLTVK
jgi:plastocyanin